MATGRLAQHEARIGTDEKRTGYCRERCDGSFRTDRFYRRAFHIRSKTRLTVGFLQTGQSVRAARKSRYDGFG